MVRPWEYNSNRDRPPYHLHHIPPDTDIGGFADGPAGADVHDAGPVDEAALMDGDVFLGFADSVLDQIGGGATARAAGGGVFAAEAQEAGFDLSLAGHDKIIAVAEEDALVRRQLVAQGQ